MQPTIMNSVIYILTLCSLQVTRLDAGPGKQCDIKLWYLDLLVQGHLSGDLSASQSAVKQTIENIIKQPENVMVDCAILVTYETMLGVKTEEKKTEPTDNVSDDSDDVNHKDDTTDDTEEDDDDDNDEDMDPTEVDEVIVNTDKGGVNRKQNNKTDTKVQILHDDDDLTDTDETNDIKQRNTKHIISLERLIKQSQAKNSCSLSFYYMTVLTYEDTNISPANHTMTTWEYLESMACYYFKELCNSEVEVTKQSTKPKLYDIMNVTRQSCIQCYAKCEFYTVMHFMTGVMNPLENRRKQSKWKAPNCGKQRMVTLLYCYYKGLTTQKLTCGPSDKPVHKDDSLILDRIKCIRYMYKHSMSTFICSIWNMIPLTHPMNLLKVNPPSKFMKCSKYCIKNRRKTDICDVYISETTTNDNITDANNTIGNINTKQQMEEPLLSQSDKTDETDSIQKNVIENPHTHLNRNMDNQNTIDITRQHTPSKTDIKDEIKSVLKETEAQHALKIQFLEMQLLKLENKLLTSSMVKQNDSSTLTQLHNTILKLENELLKLNQSFTDIKMKTDVIYKSQLDEKKYPALPPSEIETKSLEIVEKQKSQLETLSKRVQDQTINLEAMKTKADESDMQNKILQQTVMSQSLLISELMNKVESMTQMTLETQQQQQRMQYQMDKKEQPEVVIQKIIETPIIRKQANEQEEPNLADTHIKYNMEGIDKIKDKISDALSESKEDVDSTIKSSKNTKQPRDSIPNTKGTNIDVKENNRGIEEINSDKTNAKSEAIQQDQKLDENLSSNPITPDMKDNENEIIKTNKSLDLKPKINTSMINPKNLSNNRNTIIRFFKSILIQKYQKMSSMNDGCHRCTDYQSLQNDSQQMNSGESMITSDKPHEDTDVQKSNTINTDENDKKSNGEESTENKSAKNVENDKERDNEIGQAIVKINSTSIDAESKDEPNKETKQSEDKQNKEHKEAEQMLKPNEENNDNTPDGKSKHSEDNMKSNGENRKSENEPNIDNKQSDDNLKAKKPNGENKSEEENKDSASNEESKTSEDKIKQNVENKPSKDEPNDENKQLEDNVKPNGENQQDKTASGVKVDNKQSIVVDTVKKDNTNEVDIKDAEKVGTKAISDKESANGKTTQKKQDVVEEDIKMEFPYKDPYYSGFKDCYDYYKDGKRRDQMLKIQPIMMNHKMQVYCDMRNGGWTVIQKRIDGKLDFYRTWDEYKKGFGSPISEQWIGNRVLHFMTHQEHYTLRIDLTDWDNNKVYAEYKNFQVADEKNGYRLLVSGYSGTAGDSFSKHNGMKFSTYDVDNDKADKDFDGSCAKRFHGAWWYYKCYKSNLNGQYYSGGHIPGKLFDGVTWKAWKKSNYSLKKVEMKIRPALDCL